LIPGILRKNLTCLLIGYMIIIAVIGGVVDY
jgi:hypothetical protein